MNESEDPKNPESPENPSPKVEMTKKNPIAAAIILFALGALAVAFSLNSIEQNGKYYPKLLCMGMLALFYGVAIFIAPGAKNVESSGKGHAAADMFRAADPWTRTLWIVYLVASIGATIYIAISADTWNQIWGVFMLLGFFSGLFFAIKYIAVIVRLSKVTDDGLSTAEKDPEGFDYFNPNKSFSIFGIIFGLVVAGLCTYGFATKALLMEFETGSSKATNQALIVDNLDNEFPVRFLNIDGSITAVVETSYEDDEITNLVRIPLKELVFRTIFDTDYHKDHEYFNGLTNLVLDDNDNYTDYDGKKLKRIKTVKQQYKDYDEYFLNTHFDYKEVDAFVVENYEKAVIYSNPDYDSEFVMVWSLPAFTEYFNSIGNSSDEPFTAADIFSAFFTGQFDSTTFGMTTLDSILESICNLEDRDASQGILVNFGLDGHYFVHGSDLALTYKNYREEHAPEGSGNSESESGEAVSE